MSIIKKAKSTVVVSLALLSMSSGASAQLGILGDSGQLSIVSDLVVLSDPFQPLPAFPIGGLTMPTIDLTSLLTFSL